MTDGHYPRSYACIASDISIIQAQEDRSALSPLIIAWNICTLWLCYSIGDSDVKVSGVTSWWSLTSTRNENVVQIIVCQVKLYYRNWCIFQLYSNKSHIQKNQN